MKRKKELLEMNKFYLPTKLFRRFYVIYESWFIKIGANKLVYAYVT